MLPPTIRRLWTDFTQTRFATTVIALVALIGVLATAEKWLMAARMAEKFGVEERVPVLLNPSTFYVFTALSIGCVAAGITKLVYEDVPMPALERLALRASLLIHIGILGTLFLMLVFGFAIAWDQ